jgi:hypothetical protein
MGESMNFNFQKSPEQEEKIQL